MVIVDMRGNKPEASGRVQPEHDWLTVSSYMRRGGSRERRGRENPEWQPRARSQKAKRDGSPNC